ncbi:MAG: PepSY-associated TM helix domain-containing protein [Methylococcales bacterium]|nr:PepSY-associated TM helix domain-containing protein [Methylococcales bacterium]
MALIGLTGSISIYRENLDTLLNPQLYIEEPSGTHQSLDKIMASVHAAHPNRYGAWTIEMPGSPHQMITAWYEKPTETFFELYAPLMVSVDPYTGKVICSRFWGQTATTWLLDLHTQLRLSRFGWNSVGILGGLLIVSCVSGLYLWWPGTRGLRQSLAIRHTAGMMRLALDLHRLLGLLCTPGLLLLACTGFLLSFPSVLESLAGSSGMEHGQTGRTITSTAVPNKHPTGLGAAASVAQGPFPRAELRRITTPAGDTGIYRINFRQASEINRRHPYTTVWVDRWSGQIKEVRNPTQFSKGGVFASWIWPLHTGEALGATGRLAWFFSGISLFVLYVSGLIRWLCKNRLLRDREVNFSALRPMLLKMGKILYRIGLRAILVLGWLMHEAKRYLPYVNSGYQWLSQEILRLINRQK